MTGSDFFAKLQGLAKLDSNKRVVNVAQVENLILTTFQNQSNWPDFMKKFVPITFTDGTQTLTLHVTPDYLCIGTDQDFLRMPMKPGTAQPIADTFDCMLPTSKMVDAIFAQAKVNLEMIALPNNYYDVAQFKEHNDKIEAARKAAGHTLGELIDNLKKDLIISKHLAKPENRKWLHFHGWHWGKSAGKAKAGKLVQEYTGAASSPHDINWVDYSHGVRLVKNDVLSSTGGPQRMKDVLQDKAAAKLLSLDGPFDPTLAKYDPLPSP
jgi:hypothetical protein